MTDSLYARHIGPAIMSGRIVTIDVLESNPSVIYVGGATSGVWKSADAGTTWQPVFLDQDTTSIGVVKIDQRRPETIWAGTGESKPRYNTGVGTGIYRSLDGGHSWNHLGLARSERIHEIVPHPTDPDTAWVAAVGPAWSDGDERGVFRTTNGGRTWERVLYVDERTGAADLVADPRNPNKLLAAMWEFRREPWFRTSGGPGSGFYLSRDGGDSWRRITAEDGFRDGPIGRMGIAVAPSNPNVVYAWAEIQNGAALYRSDDGGISWREVGAGKWRGNRAFNHAELTVDPLNENRIYQLGVSFYFSEDGGETPQELSFEPRFLWDYQAIWIDPADPDHLIMGADNGLGISHNRGKSWRRVENLPFAQFSHLSVDMEMPYHVYGGLQDNRNWRGPSSVWEAGGIQNRHWTHVGPGEAGDVLAIPGDARFVYCSAPIGQLWLNDMENDARQLVTPPAPDERTWLRMNNAMGLALDPFNPNGVYFGSQLLHYSPDRGSTWRVLSPDLTTNDSEKQNAWVSGGLTWERAGGEEHTTIFSIAPSLVEQGLIWVGSDDGKLHLTRDGGGRWLDLTERLPCPRPGAYIGHIEASVHDAAVAFVAVDDHRRGDFNPYVYRTTDYGETWENLVGEPVRGNARVIIQDPVEPRLLFLGTEFGLWFSLDEGKSWSQWRNGLPSVQVTGLAVHPREHDLAVGTFGLGVYIIDDIQPLRALAHDPSTLNRPAHLFEPSPVIQYRESSPPYAIYSHSTFTGENRPRGAILTYVGSAEPHAQARIEILDPDDHVVQTLDGPAGPGLRRVVWDLTAGPGVEGHGEWEPPARLDGPEVLPGQYQVRVIIGERTSTQSVEILPDPRVPLDIQARRERIVLLERLSSGIERLHEQKRRLDEAAETVALLLRMSGRNLDESDSETVSAGANLLPRLRVLSRTLSFAGERGTFGRNPDPGNDAALYEMKLRDVTGGVLQYLTELCVSLNQSWEPLAGPEKNRVEWALLRLQRALDESDAILASDYVAFREQSLPAAASAEPGSGYGEDVSR
jgi:photosystem II stability/assembly factor-like uncharacterized protein